MRSRDAFANAASTCPALSAIGPDQFEPRETVAYLVEDQPGLVAVLDRGGMDDDSNQPPFAVDQGVDFATLYLTGVVAGGWLMSQL